MFCPTYSHIVTLIQLQMIKRHDHLFTPSNHFYVYSECDRDHKESASNEYSEEDDKQFSIECLQCHEETGVV